MTRLAVRCCAMVVAFLFLLSGCATIVSKNTQLLGINSTPDEAEVVIVDEYNSTIFKGKTPTTTVLKTGEAYFHGKDYTIKIGKDGYEGRIVAVNSRPGGWYLLGNFLFGGLIGWFVVDPLTGAMWVLNPESINVTLDGKVASKK